MSVNVYNKNEDKLNLIAGGTLYADAPVGSIQAYGGTTAPSGWLLCQGQAVSRIEYSELFATIGTAFGAGNGSTTFNVPDLRETVPVGVGENGIQTIENHDVYTLGEFKDDQFQGHHHSCIQIGGSGSTSYYKPSVTQNSNAGNGVYVKQPITDGTNGTPRTGTTTHGKQLGVNYIIKAKQVAIPFDMAEYIRNQNVLSDYKQAPSQFTAEYDGFICATLSGTGQTVTIKINGVAVLSNGVAEYGENGISALFKKGDAIITNAPSPMVCYYKLRDYTGR